MAKRYRLTHHSYVIRDRKGRFKDVQSVKRATARDKATKAKYHPKRSGYGYTGDYIQSAARKLSRSSQKSVMDYLGP